MPELPEVETVRRQLEPRLVGRVLVAYAVRDERWTAPRAPNEVVAPLLGREIVAFRRRGKYLIWEAEEEMYLLIHLRMTGNLLYDAPERTPYTRAHFGFDDGHDLRFVDPRRFGTGWLVAGEPELNAYFDARLGVEPFSDAFTPQYLRALARGSRAPVKAFLLDQRRIAGVGNIYADEALFRAKVHPLRPAGRVTTAQWELLHAGIIDALTLGIDARGASIDDFRDLDGARGSFQDRFLIHRRADEGCLDCGGPVRKILAAGRGTYVCENCQPRPRGARIVPMNR
ncbi:bifunctional DNA-formamidopyrimidine glycosylase/DNA-(apurinic or apyrimidinic site) lyase [Conexibacter sp. JD483]|uniref:bifunctional DNA-formamidopyrimidine glycosylase/DNA-(apurinic or apyrimidinic site) lyase n=1 Tax=unclassified Conexibacter TaxID=2627773 RepID=UPI0027244F50|nr:MULTISPECIES: bifunctional DNA-formamidopyrimidine glycosylase/DNA-(apurinic or apyrimidinic site) lyase [unclassified Conexibacter]MDO8185094.1 bifunctional DNA-formamidopyrimidine glycosylase/DNA-(apurinic or apyrimidinic site) lyase [Conexibacter sp. CPCC 205706]MDO8196804.1 bifunctional DNA-formamidopyrimidine glycosylase/DNA-(apurinic or apyrimidinic site) lyase [Conexibacter sp. CPCC 205762]MDR9368052.1 bifunctional DNA-formamidopyrimidine glycosylase/DNA-(apurinic or apyrimidinic site)